MKNKIGFIGLGLMGDPICRHIQNAKFSLSVWNRTLSKCQPFRDSGAFIANNSHELAEKSDIIIMCVTDESAVERILFSFDGLLAADNKPIVIDHSTISPIKAKEFSEKAKKNGVVYIDAPLTGSVPGAIAGTLLAFLGGDQMAVCNVEHVLKTYTNKISYMGESGMGQITKMCNQIMLHNTIISTFETIAFARKQGLDPLKLFDALENSLIDSNAWRIFGLATFNNGEKLAHIKDMMKDMNYVKFLAAETGSSLYLTTATINLMEIAIDKGMGTNDVSDLIKLY